VADRDHFLVQRGEVEHPDAPDGSAIIGVDTAETKLRQRYFDSRGAVRVCDMTFADNIWRLERHALAPDFSQHFTGTFSDDGNTIVGRWEISSDSSDWKPDFDLTYTRTHEPAYASRWGAHFWRTFPSALAVTPVWTACLTLSSAREGSVAPRGGDGCWARMCGCGSSYGRPVLYVVVACRGAAW
jgi:hypothetical protein